MYRLSQFASLIVLLFSHAVADEAKNSSKTASAHKEAAAFKPFTGKIVGAKVRLRTAPDLDGHVVRQLNKNDLLLILGEEGDFWAVKAPHNIKSYVFRSFVIDNTIEANKVNIRLEPNMEAPVIGQLPAGTKVTGQTSLLNNKWLEITPPDSVRFYVSKEFVTLAGPADYLPKMEKRRTEVESLLNTSYLLAKEECSKPFEQMHPQETIAQFEKVIKSYAEFEDEVKQAKEGLAALQEIYLKKKISYLEANTSDGSHLQEITFPALAGVEAKAAALYDTNIWDRRSFSQKSKDMTSKMRFWHQVEESLFSSWTSFHADKKIDDFYREQKVNAQSLSGILENFDPTLKHRPGDYVLKENGVPVAYLYSTHVDLEKMVGKEVNMQVTPRPNNHFAFPAYFVLEVKPN